MKGAGAEADAPSLELSNRDGAKEECIIETENTWGRGTRYSSGKQKGMTDDL